MASEFIFGVHSTLKLLEHQLPIVLEIWRLDGRQDKKIDPILDIAQRHAIPIHCVPRKTLDNLTGSRQHQGIAARCKKQSQLSMMGDSNIPDLIESLTPPPLILVLEEIQDPHNLGACLRSADAAGVNLVVLTRHRSVEVTPTVRKIACGAAETLSIAQAVNINRVLEAFLERGFIVVGADGTAEKRLYEVPLAQPLVVVMGGEEKGLRKSTREHCTYLAAIPMNGQVESLNVSVATGIFLFEAVRQRNQLRAPINSLSA